MTALSLQLIDTNTHLAMLYPACIAEISTSYLFKFPTLFSHYRCENTEITLKVRHLIS